MKIDVLGVKIDNINMDQSISLVDQWLSGKTKHYIVTPNPEFVVLAQKDTEFKRILNDADLSIPDGIGLKLTGKINHRVAGTDLMEKLIKLSAEKGLTAGLLGGHKEVAEKLRECLLKQYPKLKISFCGDGGSVDREGDSTSYKIPPTDILFVAFGQGKQEKWIDKNLTKYPVKVMMGVGGAFDYLSGIVPRAPGWIRALGLEWLFRLIIEPWRIKRQLSLVKFVFLLVTKHS